MGLKVKLGALCAVAALIPVIVSGGLLHYRDRAMAEKRMLAGLEVASRAALGIYERRLDELRLAVQSIADEIANRAVVSSEASSRDSATSWARLQDLLPRAQSEFSLDFILIADQSGRVLARHNDRPAEGETLTGETRDPVAARAIADGAQLRFAVTAAPVRLAPDRLALFGLERLARVERDDGTAVEEGLALEAATPIYSAGRFVGIVAAGQLLNTYSASRPGGLQNPLVAEIRARVWGPDPAESGAVVALDDTIVASSLPAGQGESPYLKGVRRDAGQEIEYLGNGREEYAVAWKPLESIEGQPIGAIGVSTPRRNSASGSASGLALLALACIVAMALGGLAGVVVGNGLARRLEALSESADRMSLGELSSPIHDTPAPASLARVLRDELTQLAEQMEKMRESFRQALDRIRKR